MLGVLTCPSMHAVWNYVVAPYNRPHFTRTIHMLQSLAESQVVDSD